ncbi:hypothetical protein ECP029943810_1274 [Escherichia coli P0299438.10]|nr:hypothetical protein EC1011_2997 [Escherichia coli 101-1]ENB89544.1 hypothetical protein ECP029943810_1274 [Escherichia coli P0299438.10]ENC06436.1 hypothetical protein ECP02994384_1365 [Escherichia coli P0299438.4]KDT03878.1 hypothetical protein AB54_1212 [Escherichia coli 2-011-08_S1_C3]KDW10908.1 hypothetical protein AC43_1055 [Escherichia coli 2-156-04_S3_C3]KEL04402.1 hypothetical protein AC61_0360 [Escherichia coli 4-203-08_S3_C3]KEM10746.1 hypothetical protein AD20_1154 [Escherichia
MKKEKVDNLNKQAGQHRHPALIRVYFSSSTIVIARPI